MQEMTRHLKVFACLTLILCVLVRLNADEMALPSIRTMPKSVAVKGTLKCGSRPAENVKVRLFRIESNGKQSLLTVKEHLAPGIFPRISAVVTCPLGLSVRVASTTRRH